MHYEVEKYNAMAVDSETDARMRIKAATQAVSFFKQVQLVASIEEAQSKINTGATAFDIFFISERFSKETAASFINKAKEIPAGQDAAFVLMLSGSGDSAGTKAAESVMHGFDGCLIEPYSVDNLTEMARIATKVKGERRGARERAALSFLLKDIMRIIDRIAYIKSCQMDVGTSLRRLKQACEVFKTFNDETTKRYYELAIELFEQADPNSIVGNANYKGASSRVRKAIVSKMLVEEEQEEQARAKRKPVG